MEFAITVHASPTSGSSSRTALEFTRAALRAGHRVSRVFFYHEGVRVGDRLAVTPQEEIDLLGEWVSVRDVHGIELAVCIAASLKRGLLNAEEARRYERLSANLHPAFEVVGLGQLIDAIQTADRFVSFAA